MIVSVPMELDNDHMEVMRIAQSEQLSSFTSSEQYFGSVTASVVRSEMKWDGARVKRAIDLLLAEGMAWLDLGGNGLEARYWFPRYVLFVGSMNSQHDVLVLKLDCDDVICNSSIVHMRGCRGRSILMCMEMK